MNRLPWLLVLLFIVSACTGGPNAPEATSPPESQTPAPEAAVTSSPPLATEPSATLRIWLPPQFDPNDGSEAGNLLKQRLAEFTARRSGVQIEVRLKAVSGPGGMLESLTATNAAAPLALPDLVLAPRAVLETAALKGLLYPYNGLIDSLESEDWYDYALQLGRLQNSDFGIPFAGDALVLVYRPEHHPVAPQSWEDLTKMQAPLVFPAGSERAAFTLAQYLAAGGPVSDAEGRPKLDAAQLEDVLGFFQSAELAGVMPFWITQYSTDEQAWEAFSQGQAHMAVTWISRYLQVLPADANASLLPTNNGQRFSLADGWVLAMGRPQVERHRLSVELAEFLTEGVFLARWTAAAGYLPVRESAQGSHPSPGLGKLIGEVATHAQTLPPADVLSAISPVLQQATLDVLKEKVSAQEAAAAAAAKFTAP